MGKDIFRMGIVHADTPIGNHLTDEPRFAQTVNIKA